MQCMAVHIRSRVLIDRAFILSCYLEHFQDLFSTKHIVQQTVKKEQDELFTIGGATKAIEQLKSVKAARVNKIPPEIRKHEGPPLHSKFHELCLLLGARQSITRSSQCRVYIRYHLDYRPTLRPWNNWSETSALIMMLLLLPTKKELCSTSLPASQWMSSALT